MIDYYLIVNSVCSGTSITCDSDKIMVNPMTRNEITCDVIDTTDTCELKMYKTNGQGNFKQIDQNMMKEL